MGGVNQPLGVTTFPCLPSLPLPSSLPLLSPLLPPLEVGTLKYS